SNVQTKRFQTLRRICVQIEESRRLPPHSPVTDVGGLDNEICRQLALDSHAPLNLSRGTACIGIHPRGTLPGYSGGCWVEIGVVRRKWTGPERNGDALLQRGHSVAETCSCRSR